MAKNIGKKVAVGAVFAAAAGYVAGILTAPKSGKESRDDIKKAASSVITEAEKQLKKLHTQLSDEITSLQEYKKKATGSAKQKCSATIEAAKSAQMRAKDVLSALHDGDSDDPELKAAIADVKKALQSIKNVTHKK